MDDKAIQSRNNPPIAFNPREFGFGLAIAAAIIFAIAGTRYYLRARTVKAITTCQANLQQIEAAKERWISEHNSLPNWTNLELNVSITNALLCPQGGKYTLGPAGQPPRCSILEHTLHH